MRQFTILKLFIVVAIVGLMCGAIINMRSTAQSEYASYRILQEAGCSVFPGNTNCYFKDFSGDGRYELVSGDNYVRRFRLFGWLEQWVSDIPQLEYQAVIVRSTNLSTDELVGHIKNLRGIKFIRVALASGSGPAYSREPALNEEGLELLRKSFPKIEITY